ncbi:caprin-2 [Salarias fasciatus]|uniref:caprin-2 n=1 Tax=Salarias fasciatus TaxID=181472 RepID=UPI001176A37F|nr:caprin-2-like [Salarias fasciatus]
MVQLSTSPTLDSTPPKHSVKGVGRLEGREEPGDGPNTQQLCLEVSTVYDGYESYIEDGLICLKHKVRNLEKKKLKLEDYKKRMSRGETLNRDQLVAVEKYDEVLHNITFARELHKTLDGLTQTLLRAQKQAVKREQMAKQEMERRRLTTVLQVQQLLGTLQQDSVQSDLLSGRNQAPYVPAHTLHSLNQLAALLGAKRDDTLSFQQMEQAALVYLDLLEGKDQPVAGSSFKLLKEELTRLLDCKYFNYLPSPVERSPDVVRSSAGHSSVLKSKPNELCKEYFNRLQKTQVDTAPAKKWQAYSKTLRDCEPPDSWDMDYSDELISPQEPAHKSWKGAATFIPKGVLVKKLPADYKQRKARKTKAEQNIMSTFDVDLPMEVFSSPCAFPKDPILRKQHLEDLMTKIHGSFSFMQDSLLDCDSSPSNGHHRLKRQPSGSPSTLVQPIMRSPMEVPAKPIHSTPLPARLLEHKGNFASGDEGQGICDLELLQQDLPHEPLQLSARKTFCSPPLYRRESNISINLGKSHLKTPVTELEKLSPCNGVESCSSTPPQAQTFSTPPSRRSLTSTQFQTIQSVSCFCLSSLFCHNNKPTSVFSEPKNTVGTQTPPEFAPLEDEPQFAYRSDCVEGNSGQILLSLGQSSGSGSRSGQPYMRGTVRGMAPGGKGLAQTFCSSDWHQGVSYMPQTLRDAGPLLYPERDQGYQHGYRRGGRHHSVANWNDSSQMGSPDQEGVFTMLDSGLGDSMSVSTLEVPLTPHSHSEHANLIPMQLYPLSQPMRVAFTASRTANFAPGNLDQPIVFDQLHSNQGDMYDAHIGRFTCPVNGTYVFIFHILKLAINVPLYINLMRNEEVMVSAYANDGAPDHETASNHAILPLFQGDQVWLRLHRGAIYGSTWKYSTFSGFLLYQD